MFGEAMFLQARARELPIVTTIVVAALVGLLALAGARLFYVASEWPSFRGRTARIWKRGESGASLFGGVLAVHFLAIPAIALTAGRIGETLDAVALAALLAVPFGRIGCLLHGCCPGRRWSWLPPAAEIVVVLAIIPATLFVGSVRAGAGFLCGAAIYAVFRFSMDFTRRDAAREGWTAAQRAALVIAMVDTCALALVL